MVNTFERATSSLEGNLNSGLSYPITTVSFPNIMRGCADNFEVKTQLLHVLI